MGIKFSPKTRLIILITLTVLFLVAFGALADSVVEDQKLIGIDTAIVTAVYAARTPLLTDLMKSMTTLASVTGVIFASAGVLSWLIITKQRRHLVALLVSLVGAGVFSELFKLLFARARPALQSALIAETGYSFPSGHTLVAVCFYGVLAYFILKAVKSMRARTATLIVAIIIVFGIGFSRIYLGVHWPTDVLASFLLGAGWLFLLDSILQLVGILRKEKLSKH